MTFVASSKQSKTKRELPGTLAVFLTRHWGPRKQQFLLAEHKAEESGRGMFTPGLYRIRLLHFYMLKPFLKPSFRLGR